MAKLRKYTGQELLKLRDTLKTDRDLFITLREQCRFYFSPQDRFTYEFKSNTANKGTPNNPKGIECARDLTAGLFSNTINLSDEFFGFQIADKDLSENNNIKDWFAKCSEISISKLAASNYSLSTLETIQDYVVVCTGVQYSEMTQDKGLRFQNFMIDHCGIAEDKDGKIDTVFRDFEMTACQAYDRWGDSIPHQIMEKYKNVNTRYEKDKYLHCVFPRLDYKKNYDIKREEDSPENMPWASYFIFEADGEIIEEGGYKSCPYAVPRFERTTSNPYGRGAAFSAKNLASGLERLSADIDDGVELRVNPPAFLPVGISDQSDIDLTPAAVNFYNPSMGMPVFYQSDIDLGSATQREEKIEAQLQELFYVNLFRMLEDQKNMTATEVAQRVAEKTQMLLPIVARLYDELYSVTLTRVFHLLLDSGFFPEMPEELLEVWPAQQLKIKYTTKLDQKLAQLEIGQVMKSLEEVGILQKMAAEFPDINAILNVGEFGKEIFRLNDVSPDYLKSDQETEDYMKAKAQAEEQAAQAEQQANMIDKINLQNKIDPNSIIGQNQAQLGGTTASGF